jgi:carbonic anhydrase
MGEDPGSVFVIRNVANLVVGTDFNLMSALQYAVAVLKVDHIILCGHYECGGIRASLETKDHVPPLENWLRNIRDVYVLLLLHYRTLCWALLEMNDCLPSLSVFSYRLHRDELDSIQDPEYRHRRLVELNVVEQCINLFKTGVVQRRRVETFKEGRPYTVPRIHACVFDPKTGDLNRLEVRFQLATRLPSSYI